MLVKNLININNGRAVANQFVIEDTSNACTYFQSYSSEIVKIDILRKEITIYPDYDYSNTTIKHRNNFFKLQGFTNLSTTKQLEKAIKDGFIESYFDGVYTIKKAS